MSHNYSPLEISIWDIPFVKHKGKVYRVINSKRIKEGNDYTITDIDSDEYIDRVEEIQKDELHISGVSNIMDIEGLSSLTFLNKLELPNSRIKEIVGLHRLANLKELNLSNNQISTISGLGTLGNLEILNLSNNLISKVEGLQNLRSLQELYLENNKISEVECFAISKGLKVLSLRGNAEHIKLENLDRLWNLIMFNK